MTNPSEQPCLVACEELGVVCYFVPFSKHVMTKQLRTILKVFFFFCLFEKTPYWISRSVESKSYHYRVIISSGLVGFSDFEAPFHNHPSRIFYTSNTYFLSQINEQNQWKSLTSRKHIYHDEREERVSLTVEENNVTEHKLNQFLLHWRHISRDGLRQMHLLFCYVFQYRREDRKSVKMNYLLSCVELKAYCDSTCRLRTSVDA